MQAELDIEERQRRRDDPIPEKAREGADRTMTVIDITAVDRARLDHRGGELIVELIVIIDHPAFIHVRHLPCRFLPKNIIHSSVYNKKLLVSIFLLQIK